MKEMKKQLYKDLREEDEEDEEEEEEEELKWSYFSLSKGFLTYKPPYLLFKEENLIKKWEKRKSEDGH